jgi:hypothetical protein
MRISEEFVQGTITASFTASTLTIPVGIGVGKRLPAGPELVVDIFAQPHLLWIRSDVEIEGSFGPEIGVDGSESEFGLGLGTNLATPTFFVGAGVGITTIEDSDPTFSLRVGLLLGRR